MGRAGGFDPLIWRAGGFIAISPETTGLTGVF